MHAYKGTGKKASNSNNIWSNHIKTRAVHGVKNNADLDFGEKKSRLLQKDLINVGSQIYFFIRHKVTTLANLKAPFQ